jgi:hypothetical protein
MQNASSGLSFTNEIRQNAYGYLRALRATAVSRSKAKPCLQLNRPAAQRITGYAEV